MIITQLALLLVRWGEDASDSCDTAAVLADKTAALAGVRALLATPGSLQLALRRTRDTPALSCHARKAQDPEHREPHD